VVSPRRRREGEREKEGRGKRREEKKEERRRGREKRGKDPLSATKGALRSRSHSSMTTSMTSLREKGAAGSSR
jgi:hypothetical protein